MRQEGGGGVTGRGQRPGGPAAHRATADRQQPLSVPRLHTADRMAGRCGGRQRPPALRSRMAGAEAVSELPAWVERSRRETRPVAGRAPVAPVRSRPLPATELASGGDTRHVYPHPLHLCAVRQVSGLVYRRADWQPEARCCRQAPQPRVLPQPRPQVLVTFTVDMVEAQAPSYNSPVTRPSARVNPLQ